MNLQAFPGDFLLKFRPDLEPADSAATTKSAGGISIPPSRLHSPIRGSAGQDLHRRQREADGPPLQFKESDMNIRAIWGANVTSVSARPIVDYSKQTLTPQPEQTPKHEKLADDHSNTSASDILRITADIARGS
jgi:hypothetical protein